MKYFKTVLIIFVLFLGQFAHIVTSQDATPTAVPLFEFTEPFPIHLHCSEIVSPYTGPTWNNIQIGVSTTDDLRDYIQGVHPDYHEGLIVSVNLIEYTLRLRTAKEFNVPGSIRACFEPQSNAVTALRVDFSSGLAHLNDLVIEYGEPDVVTWDFSTETRLAFWFEEGIAATIRVDESEQFAPYGTVLSMTYFPYQEVEGFEERWPYNRTVAGERFEELELIATLELRATWTPDVPNIANPFDFDTRIATITAQPSRTATPTFTPVATESP